METNIQEPKYHVDPICTDMRKILDKCLKNNEFCQKISDFYRKQCTKSSM